MFHATFGPDGALSRGRGADQGGGAGNGPESGGAVARVLLIAVALIVLAVGIVWGMGAALPRDHIATSRAVFHQPPEVVWGAIADFEGTVDWWSGVESVERGPDWRGNPVWVISSDFGDMPLAVLESDPPRRMVTEIAGEELPFAGTWTWRIEPSTAGCVLSITERGSVDTAFFRFMSRYVIGYHGTMDGLMRDLGRKFGEDVEPVHVDDPA